MSDTDGRKSSDSDPQEPIFAEPRRYSFFAALRKIESMEQDRARLGETRRIQEDPVRIVQDPVMHFSSSEVVRVDEGSPMRLHIESFGLFGPNGALPLHLTDYAATRLRRQEDRAFLDFVTLLQHRMATLFFRAWATAAPTVNSEEFRACVGALMGVGDDTLRGRDQVDDDAKLYRAGRFALSMRPREGLEDVLSDYFRTPVSVRDFDPRWLEIPADQRMVLGGGSGRLGVDATTGRRSWQCQFSFRVILSGMRYEEFERFLPGGPSLRRLRDLILLYVGKEQRWKAELRLLPGEAPPLKLSSGRRLGWTTWIGRRRDFDPCVVIRDSTAFREKRAA